MNGLEQRIVAADIGTSRGSHAALNLRRFIRDDVAVQVRQHEHLELTPNVLVHQVRRHDVDEPVIRLNFRIILGYFLAKPQEIAIRLLHNIRLRDDGHPLLAVRTGELISRSRDTKRAFAGRHLEIHIQRIANPHAPASQRVLALRVLPEERPVDALLRNGYRPHIRIQVKSLPQIYICTFQILRIHGCIRRRRRALEEHVALLHLRQHLVRHGLPLLQTILQREALNLLQLNLARSQLLRQQFL